MHAPPPNRCCLEATELFFGGWHSSQRARRAGCRCSCVMKGTGIRRFVLFFLPLSPHPSFSKWTLVYRFEYSYPISNLDWSTHINYIWYICVYTLKAWDLNIYIHLFMKWSPGNTSLKSWQMWECAILVLGLAQVFWQNHWGWSVLGSRKREVPHLTQKPETVSNYVYMVGPLPVVNRLITPVIVGL